jgi:hypothetical protein
LFTSFLLLKHQTLASSDGEFYWFQDQEEIFKDGTIKFLNRIETIRKASGDKVDIYGEFGNYAFDVLSEFLVWTIGLIDSGNCVRRAFQKGVHSTWR